MLRGRASKESAAKQHDTGKLVTSFSYYVMAGKVKVKGLLSSKKRRNYLVIT